jgi:urease accessory protein
MEGSGALDFESVDGRTVVRQALARSPLRLLNPQNHGQGAWVYTSSYGGGLVDGDSLALQVRVRSRAQAVLLTQSATKVYRSERGSSQSVEATVEAGATLVSIPDLVMCFESARFSQTQTFRLGSGSSLLLVDGISCGRHASGECWRFDRYESKIRVFQENMPVFLESLLLDSSIGNLASRNEPFNAFAIALMIGPAFEAFGRELEKRVAGEPLNGDPHLVRSASAVAGGRGTLLRLAAIESQDLVAGLREFLAFLPEQLGDDPWARKW